MPDDVPFESALAELERVLRDLEDGTTTLDDALARYETGVGLLRVCYAKLRDAEHKIQQLAGLTADGKPDLQVFEHTAAVEKPPTAPTRRRPAAKPAPNPDGLF